MKKPIALLTLIAVAIYCLLRPAHPGGSVQSKIPVTPAPVVAPVPERTTASAAPGIHDPSQTSLATMAQTLSQFTARGENIANLIEHLKEQGQSPFLARDKNPYTGEMTIVRTNSPLVGTRYFHAQYFANEAGEPFVQHMSFEYKPGPTAMSDTVATVQSAFRNLGQPTVQNDSYVQWNLGDDHIVWVKKMEAEDLQDDPFNSYGPEDVGTIRVAVELEIHER